MRLRPAAILAAGAAVLALALPLRATAWTTQGGATLEPGRDAVEAAIGWPGLRLGGRIPLKQGFEIGPYVTFTYWNDLLDKNATLGNAVGCRGKVNLVDKGAFQLAVQVDPSMRIEYWPDGLKVGWQIGFPEVLMSYELTPGLDLDFGLKMPVSLVFDTDYQVEVRLPLLVGLGFEYGLSSDLNLFAGVEVGPNFRFAKEQPICGPVNAQGQRLCDTRNTTGGNRIGVYLQALIGITYRVP